LWRPLRSCRNDPVRHCSSLKVAPDDQQYPFVFDLPGQARHQDVVLNPVEELLQVNIDAEPIARVDVALHLLYGTMG